MKKSFVFALAISLLVGNVWGMRKEPMSVGQFLTEGPVELLEHTFDFLPLQDIYRRIANVNNYCRYAVVQYARWGRGLDVSVNKDLLQDKKRLGNLFKFLENTICPISLFVCAYGDYDKEIENELIKLIASVQNLRKLVVRASITGVCLHQLHGKNIEELQFLINHSFREDNLIFLKLRLIRRYK